MNPELNIVYTTDRGYLPQTAVSITSVCENNKEIPCISFFVLGQGLSREDQRSLADLAKSYGTEGHARRLVVREIGRMETYFDFSFDTSGWNPIVLARLVMDRFLPEDMERVLYLDGDTIVRGDLRPLWTADLHGCVIGACAEPTCSHERKEALGLKGMPYYNAGVLLVDLKRWRGEGAGREIIEYYRNSGGALFANDQDAINAGLKGRIYSLSVTYNYHNTYDIYRYRLLEKNCDYPVPSREELALIRRDPCIVHFLGEERPWRRGNTHRFRDEYLAYLDRTPWKGEGLEDGWREYFVCWRIFNLLMRPFPMTRLRLINELIPVMLKRRQKRLAE